MRAPAVPALLLLLALLWTSVECRREDVGPSSSSASLLRIGREFGADAGAELSLSLQLDTKEVEQFAYLVVYNPEQYQRAIYYGDYECQLASVLRYEFHQELNVTVTLKEKDLYYLYLLNCYEEPLHIGGTIRWLNPQHGVEELALDEQKVYWSCSALLLPLCATLLAWYSVSFLHLRELRVLHVLLTVSITAAALARGIRQYYFEMYKASGSPSGIVKYTADCVTVLGDTSFLAALLLIAMGWSIVRNRLNVRHKQLLWGATLLYTGFNLAYLLCTYPENLCTVYMLFFVMIKFLILLTMVVALNAECEYVRMEFDSGDDRRRALREKLHVFLRIRRLLLALMAIPLFAVVLQFFLLSWDDDWIITALNDALYIFAFWIVGYSFRPRARADDHIFARSRPRPQQEEEQALNRNSSSDEEEADEDAEGDNSDAESEEESSFDRFDEEAFLREVEPNGIPLDEISPATEVEEV